MKIAKRGRKKKSVSGKNIQTVEQLTGLPGSELIQQSSLHKIFTSALCFPMYKLSKREFK